MLCMPCNSTHRWSIRWWLSSSPNICHELVYCRIETDQNSRKSGSKNIQPMLLYTYILAKDSKNSYPELKTLVYDSYL